MNAANITFDHIAINSPPVPFSFYRPCCVLIEDMKDFVHSTMAAWEELHCAFDKKQADVICEECQ